MKKLLIVAVVAAMALVLTGCGSVRTPTSGPRKGNVGYVTFFGITIEGLVYNDGLIISPMK